MRAEDRGRQRLGEAERGTRRGILDAPTWALVIMDALAIDIDAQVEPPCAQEQLAHAVQGELCELWMPVHPRILGLLNGSEALPRYADLLVSGGQIPPLDPHLIAHSRLDERTETPGPVRRDLGQEEIDGERDHRRSGPPTSSELIVNLAAAPGERIHDVRVGRARQELHGVEEVRLTRAVRAGDDLERLQIQRKLPEGFESVERDARDH